jgi:CRISPR-associated endonuclease/helicase Cas3
LQGSADRAEGQTAAHASIAHENGLKLETGYVVGDYMDWWRDAVTPTRLGDATSSVRLARWVDGNLLPWNTGEHDWDMSQVRISEKWINKTAMPVAANQRAEVERVLSGLPDQGKWSVLLPLETRGNGLWSGVALDVKGEQREWLYCTNIGLRLLASNSCIAGDSHESD